MIGAGSTPRAVGRAPAVVAAAGLRVARSGRRALDGVDLDAHGGVTALLGPNGAGKTTLLRCLATVIRPDEGAVRVDGLDPADELQRTEIRRRLGYRPQQPAFAPAARAFDALDVIAVAKELAPERRRRAEVWRVLAATGLADRAGDRVRDLSGGMVSRLGTAQAMLGAPTLLLLDEPETGLDPDRRLELRTLLADLGADTTVVVATHHLDEAVAIAARLVVLDRGRVVFAGTATGLAATARGRVWRSATAPPAGVRAAWRLPDGSHRCLGDPPPGAELLEPTAEDGYLRHVDPGAVEALR